MPQIFSGNSRKVIVSRSEVQAFNDAWPCSKLNPNRHYWFEFEANGDLVDHDVPEHSDGPECVAMADDCKAFLFDGVSPDWGDA